MLNSECPYFTSYPPQRLSQCSRPKNIAKIQEILPLTLLSKSKMLTLLAKVTEGIRWHAQITIIWKRFSGETMDKKWAGYKETRKSSKLTALKQITREEKAPRTRNETVTCWGLMRAMLAFWLQDSSSKMVTP